MRDDGRPFGVGYQEQASNHSKLLRSKVVGGEHWRLKRLGGVNLPRALVRNCGNQSFNDKGEAQVAASKRRECQCGVLGQTNLLEQIGLVMQSEQRGWVKRLHSKFNCQREEMA